MLLMLASQRFTVLTFEQYRERARKLHPHITEPEMVMPISAHVAHDKGGHLFDIKCVHVPVNPETFRVDLEAYRRAITPNTIMLVASAPQYPQGAS